MTDDNGTSHIERALLAALDPRSGTTSNSVARAALSTLEARDCEALAQLAIRTRMAPLLLQRLELGQLHDCVAPEARSQLVERARTSSMRSLRYQAEFKRVARALTAAGVRVVALKGIHLASSVYANCSLREMNDIDILVPANDIVTASAIVAEAGFRPMDETPIEVSLAVSHHLPRFVKPGVSLELHNRLMTDDVGAAIDAESLFRRAVPFALERDTWALCAEDALIHIAVHASVGHLFGQGLRPTFDVAALIERHEDRLNWADLVAQAYEWRVTRSVRLLLELARRHAGARVPTHVLSALGIAVPSAILDTSLTLCLSAQLPTANPSAMATRLLSKEPLRDRLAHLKRRMWCSPELLASLYHATPDHVRRRLTRYRLRRGWDLARTQGPRLLRLRLGAEAKTRNWIDRRNGLSVWLRGG